MQKTDVWIWPELEDFEVNVIRESLKACPKDRIVDVLARYLAVHKRIPSSAEDTTEFLFRDTAQLIFGLPEHAIFLGVFHIIEKDESVWWPSVKRINEACEEYRCAWPAEWEKHTAAKKMIA